MVKLLKFSVVVNLLLACGAAYFAYKQFAEREIIKSRMQKLEASAQGVASALPKATPLEKPEAPKEILSQLNSDGIKTLDTLGDPDPERGSGILGALIKHVRAYHTYLEETEQNLAQTKSELNATKDKLAATETELANTKQELEATKTELASTKTDLAAARERIDALGVEVADLKTTINTLNETVQKKEDDIAKLDSELNTTRKELDRTKRELRICKLGSSTTDLGVMENQESNILLVNKDWNFLVLDKGRENEFLSGAEGLIRRGDKLIGKVTISMVEDRISVADIRLDTLEPGEEVKQGDIVWFPPSKL